MVYFGWAKKPGIYYNVSLPVEVYAGKGLLNKLFNGMGLPRAHHIVSGLLLLEHQPHRLHIIAGKAPVPLGIQIAQMQLRGQPQLDPRYPIADLAGDELQPTTA